MGGSLLFASGSKPELRQLLTVWLASHPSKSKEKHELCRERAGAEGPPSKTSYKGARPCELLRSQGLLVRIHSMHEAGPVGSFPVSQCLKQLLAREEQISPQTPGTEKKIHEMPWTKCSLYQFHLLCLHKCQDETIEIPGVVSPYPFFGNEPTKPQGPGHLPSQESRAKHLARSEGKEVKLDIAASRVQGKADLCFCSAITLSHSLGPSEALLACVCVCACVHPFVIRL